MTSNAPTRATSLPELLAVAGANARLLASGVPGDVQRDAPVLDVTHDSREVRAGTLFACRPGAHTDGHDHAPAAVAAGAPALLVERPLPLAVAQLQVPSVAAAMGPVAAAVHGNPSQELLLCGVTGTNGKTTTVYLLDAVLAAAGHTTGVIGTVETRIAGRVVAGSRTTPESTDIQRLLRTMRDAGVTAGAMEVSSHGLALGRVRGTRFAVGLFTNLTQDHLDFHGGMEEYYTAKRALFGGDYARAGVVNIDDPYGLRLAEESAVPVVTVSPVGARAQVRATSVEATAAGSDFTADLRGRAVRVHTALPGLFNVANALMALAAAEVIGIDPDAAADALATCSGVPGRMERIDAGQPFTVIVDYAHTPDSLANVLSGVRDVTTGRVLVVIGCGGDRDAGKRPLMGRAAAELADWAVFTNDNPRSEDPAAIVAAVVAGARQVDGARWDVELDRRAAIGAALAAAEAGDVVVIAGKGHERTQELADRTIAFDDRVVARELLGDGTAA